MAQAVSCWPLTVEARANSQTVWNLWWMSVMGQGFPEYFGFRLSLLFRQRHGLNFDLSLTVHFLCKADRLLSNTLKDKGVQDRNYILTS